MPELNGLPAGAAPLFTPRMSSICKVFAPESREKVKRVAWFGAVDPDAPEGSVLGTASGSCTALPGTEPGLVKVTPFTEYPPKGRATGGVRCHRFLKGEDALVFAWVGAAPARAAATSGAPVALPATPGRRDGSGVPAAQPIAACSGPVAVRVGSAGPVGGPPDDDGAGDDTRALDDVTG